MQYGCRCRRRQFHHSNDAFGYDDAIDQPSPEGFTPVFNTIDESRRRILDSSWGRDWLVHPRSDVTCLNLLLAHDTLGPASPDPRLYVADEQTMEPAVQYVQKIKQRCDPDTYRQFLDILSQYHHKPGTMDEVSFKKSPTIFSN